MERAIRLLGDPVLQQIAAPVTDFSTVDGLVRDLADTLAGFRSRSGFGRGIAAPQLGVLARVILLRVPGGFEGALVNPVIVEASDEKFELWDDCFSFPDLLVRVARHRRVRVEYRDQRGAARSLDGEGALSELLQHEIDHLDGILAVARAVEPGALCLRSEWERRFR